MRGVATLRDTSCSCPKTVGLEPVSQALYVLFVSMQYSVSNPTSILSSSRCRTCNALEAEKYCTNRSLQEVGHSGIQDASNALGQSHDDELPNTTRQIEKKLREYARMAKEHGLETLRVICEPFGGYQSKLLRTARRLGPLTAYVNGEAVAKFRVVETNDNGKTDLKDPHIIHTLASINKVLRHRERADEYLLLRKTGRALRPGRPSYRHRALSTPPRSGGAVL